MGAVSWSADGVIAMLPVSDSVHRETKEELARHDIEDGRELERALRQCPWCGRRNPPGELWCSPACEERWSADWEGDR